MNQDRSEPAGRASALDPLVGRLQVLAVLMAENLIDYDIGAGAEAQMVRDWLTPNSSSTT
jgi:hypothetical protein